jgi:TadE-like protein/PKD domain
MRLPRLLSRRHERHQRGQGLVELALLLPVLLLLLVMAIDFGRVFFGWVALHNAARIGANYAAANAHAWDGMKPPYQLERDRFQELVLNDLQSLNCQLPAGDPVDEPVFAGFADGDLVQVQINCAFGLVTPLAESVFGGPIQMTVMTDFAIYRTHGNAPVDGGGAPPPPERCGTPVTSFTTVPAPPSPGSQVVINTGQSVTFTDTSDTGEDCGTPTWAWDFGEVGTEDTEGPHTKTFTNPGPPTNKDYTVTLTVTTSYGSDTESIVVRVKK